LGASLSDARGEGAARIMQVLVDWRGCRLLGVDDLVLEALESDRKHRINDVLSLDEAAFQRECKQ